MKAYLRSLQKMDRPDGTHVEGDVDSIRLVNGNYVAAIGDCRYSAIWNPFVQAFFVDDVDGRIGEDQ
jgi:hypothetical protein